MLVEAVDFLNRAYKGKFELLIIDDGSKDGTAEYALQLAEELSLAPHILRVVRFEKNRGKGGAVCHGVQLARGRYIIFADADGASKFSDLGRLMDTIKGLDQEKPESKAALVVGSRAHMVSTDAVVKRSFLRNLLMYGLHTLVYVFGIRDIKDTQCGFKLFNKLAVRRIFPYLHTERWIFDVEILILAERQKIPVAEVPISWHEVEGSKMVLARDSVNMAIDLVVTRMAYILGIYDDGNGKAKRE
ncbi:DEKNAAC100284 [Brettanomyces naardenensis]|uniref:dolichyl-phosphate beta-glucosyltransferase n=1 Tax=Brettanomyces naardenensis TaxID=13370 RepID=A0A448YFS4_BRENA|nr:DEKNAAC100284 [Brettanomyces naardenensis]